MSVFSIAQRKILVVEDELAIAEPLIYAFKREGWQVDYAQNARQAIAVLQQQCFDFIVLDVGLPDMNGFDLCRHIRQSWLTPLLFLTARQDEIDRIIGLELGADDYCTKPFSAKELISRIKAVWRRMEQTLAQQHEPMGEASSLTSDRYGCWVVDAERLQIGYYDQFLQLTRYEFKLLHYLILNPERVYSRSELMEQVWDNPDHSLERTVDTHIKSIRQKLKAIHPDDPITTHRGFGYSLKQYDD